jgi:hypothetical protein
MAVIRLTLLVVVLGGLTLLLVQNFSPALPLVFLGMRSQPIPLAVWILFSTAAGAGTSLLITSLFRLSNYFGGQSRQTPPKSTSRRSTANRKEEFTPPPSAKEPASKTNYTANDEFDDWETNSADDDWDIEDKPREATTTKSQPDSFSDSATYERPQQPKSGSQSGSTYSYSYREPKNTAAGKSESVYDADYRVIIPPYQSPTKDTTDDDDDDWGFDDDE